MSGHKKCSRDDCPPAHTHKEHTTTCGKCGDTLHLMCIGINEKVCTVLIHPNLRLLCNGCSSGSSTTAANKSVMLKQSKLLLKPQASPNTSSSVLSTQDNGELLQLLEKIHHVVSDTNTKVTSHVTASSKSYADILKDVKELNTNTKTVVSRNERSSFAAVTARRNGAFPSLGGQTPKRRRESSPPKKFTGRTLLAGTATVAEHGLGDSVPMAKVQSQSKSKNMYAHLTKSIYVSRLQTSVTEEKINAYIRTRLPSITSTDISLRLLVKKDAKLDELSFVSYRLACTESLYEQFMHPSFWPAHVMIGEFIERERPAAKISDLIPSTPAMTVNRPSPNASPNKESVTNPLMDTN